MSHALATVRHGGRRPPVNPKSEIRNSRDGWVASDPFPYPYPFPSPTGRVGRHSLPLSSRARRAEESIRLGIGLAQDKPMEWVVACGLAHRSLGSLASLPHSG